MFFSLVYLDYEISLCTYFQLFLGVVYYTVGNIDPKHRSQLGAIQLLAVATSPIIKKIWH